jgi:hypothetical protein
MSKASIYKITFFNQNSIYEIYAKHIDPGLFYGFVEVEDLIFSDASSSLVVDPAEEKLKTEFSGVKKTYIPLHSILRIDEVDKEGTAKIKEQKGKSGNVAQFPGASYSQSDFNNKP